MRKSQRIALVLALAIPVALSCRGDESATPAADTAAAERPDLAALIADIRNGLAGISGRVGEDPTAARGIAMELYATRQELIEVHYGVVEHPHVTPALASEVETAEHRFHELLETLSPEQPDTLRVSRAATMLMEQLESVEREARRAGLMSEE
jgi:hypothetical protein